MRLRKIVEHAIDKERFQSVQDYIDFCKRFLDFTNSGIQAVILSQNEQHYKFLQFSERLSGGLSKGLSQLSDTADVDDCYGLA